MTNESLNFKKSGQGPSIIFLHNGGGYKGIWDKQVEFLKENYSCYAIDLMGFGESEETSEEPSISFHENILKKFIKDQGIEKPILIGNCIGASIALKYTIDHPKDVNQLVLFNICPGINFYPNPLTKFLHRVLISTSFTKRIVSDYLYSLMGNKRERKNLPKQLFGENPDTTSEVYLKLSEIYLTEKQKRSRIKLLHQIETFTTDFFFDKKITLPRILMFWGDQNKVVGLDEGLRLKELIEPEQFCIIRNGGHLSMYEKGEVVNKKIEEFLSSKHVI